MVTDKTNVNARRFAEDESSGSKRRATNKILTALLSGYLCAIAWTVYADIVYHNQVPLEAFQFHGLYPVSLGLCAVITAFLYDGNVRDIGFTRSHVKYSLYAFGLAAVITLVPFLLNLLLGGISLNPSPQIDSSLVAVGIPVLIILGLGEEVMWRGILYTNMSRLFNFWWTSVIIGLLWALWHYPVIIHTKFLYADRPSWFALLMLTTMTIFLSFVFNHLRAISRSIWPCVILHAFLNYIIFVFIEPLEVGTAANAFLFKSDIGIIYILVIAIVSVVVMKRHTKLAQ